MGRDSEQPEGRGKLLALPTGETERQRKRSLFIVMRGVFQQQPNHHNLYHMAETYIEWCETEMSSQGFREGSKQYQDEVETALRTACSEYPYAKALLAQLKAFLQELDAAQTLMAEAEAEAEARARDIGPDIIERIKRLCELIRRKIADAARRDDEWVRDNITRRRGEDAD